MIDFCPFCDGSNNVTVSDKTSPDDYTDKIHLDKDWKNKEFYVDYIKPNVTY